MKEITALQATYFSEPVNGTYFTIGITSADYDRGKIIGQRGEGKFLGSYLDGWLEWKGGGEAPAEIYLDFVNYYCQLKCDDNSFNRLYGVLVSKPGGQKVPIVFNKAKDEVVSG